MESVGKLVNIGIFDRHSALIPPAPFPHRGEGGEVLAGRPPVGHPLTPANASSSSSRRGWVARARAISSRLRPGVANERAGLAAGGGSPVE